MLKKANCRYNNRIKLILDVSCGAANSQLRSLPASANGVASEAAARVAPSVPTAPLYFEKTSNFSAMSCVTCSRAAEEACSFRQR